MSKDLNKCKWTLITFHYETFFISSNVAIIAKAELFSNQSPIQTPAAKIAKKMVWISMSECEQASWNAISRLRNQHHKYIEQQLLKRKGDFVRIINKPGLKHGIENWILKLNLVCTKERDVDEPGK